jgi:hypothetical protein
MRKKVIGRVHSEQTKLKLSANNLGSQPVKLINNDTGDTKDFATIKEGANHIGLSYHYVARFFFFLFNVFFFLFYQ